MDDLEKARLYDYLTFTAKLISRHIRAQSPNDLAVTANCIALADFAAEFNRRANDSLSRIADRPVDHLPEVIDLNDPRM